MESFDFEIEREFNPIVHVEKKLGYYDQGDVSIACWEPGQVSPNHCHPDAVEIYFCYEGGGIMLTDNEELKVKKGCFVIHPKGELHEFTTGKDRTILFRVRYGKSMISRTKDWPTNPKWKATDTDREYFST
jgi:quercetin dioxygenase-like cupin family protein